MKAFFLGLLFSIGAKIANAPIWVWLVTIPVIFCLGWIAVTAIRARKDKSVGAAPKSETVAIMPPVKVEIQQTDVFELPPEKIIKDIYGKNYQKDLCVPIRVTAARRFIGVQVRVMEVENRPLIIPFELPMRGASATQDSYDLDPGVTAQFLAAEWRQGSSIREINFMQRSGEFVPLIEEYNHSPSVMPEFPKDRCRFRVEVWSQGESLGYSWVHLTLSNTGNLKARKGPDYLFDEDKAKG